MRRNSRHTEKMIYSGRFSPEPQSKVDRDTIRLSLKALREGKSRLEELMGEIYLDNITDVQNKNVPDLLIIIADLLHDLKRLEGRYWNQSNFVEFYDDTITLAFQGLSEIEEEFEYEVNYAVDDGFADFDGEPDGPVQKLVEGALLPILDRAIDLIDDVMEMIKDELQPGVTYEA